MIYLSSFFFLYSDVTGHLLHLYRRAFATNPNESIRISRPFELHGRGILPVNGCLRISFDIKPKNARNQDVRLR